MSKRPHRYRVWLVYRIVGATVSLGLVAASQIRSGVAPLPIAISMLAAALSALFVIEIILRRNRLRAARYEAIVERAADGIITANTQGEIKFVNRAAEELFGYRESELLGNRVSVLLTAAYSEDEEGDLWGFLSANASRATGVAHEVIGLKRDGSKFFMDLSTSTAIVGGSDVVVVIARDVTGRKKAQIAIAKARDELEARVEERTADLQRSNEQLEKAVAEVKTLSGFIPICASCKKVRDDSGYWNQIEVYIRDRSDAEFSHGICRDCAEKLYPERKGGGAS